MAYTTIDKSSLHFNTLIYTGNSGTQSVTGVGFQPDWVWIKKQDGSDDHVLYDAIRGATKHVHTNTTDAEDTQTDGLTSFDSNGFSLGADGKSNQGHQYVSWNWLANGASPAITYAVKVVSDSGNKYRFDDFGTSAVTLDLQEGGTYTFDQSDSSNSGHPLRFSTTSNGTHGGGSEYTTGVTTTGTPGSSGAKTVITVASGAPTLYYYCTQHSAMGGQANTNSTFGSSNFKGSIQSTVSANTTSGFSIIKYTGTGSNATIGHGLSTPPRFILVKQTSGSSNDWGIYYNPAGGYNGQETRGMAFSSSGFSTAVFWNNTAATSSVFTIGAAGRTNQSSATYIAYAFADVVGYQKFCGWKVNANADGPFIYTGFKPAFFMMFNINNSGRWMIADNKRNPHNEIDKKLQPHQNNTEATTGDIGCDFLSNGIKIRGGGTSDINHTNGNIMYGIIVAEAPLVGSNNIPCTAR